MAADPAGLRFFVDESLLGVGKALPYAREDVVHAGHRLVPAAPLGAKDTEWMPAVAGLDLAVFTRDRHLRTRPGEVELLRNHGLRVFFLAGRRDLSNWGYLVRLVKRWDDVEDVMRLRGPGPWFIAVVRRHGYPQDRRRRTRSGGFAVISLLRTSEGGIASSRADDLRA